MATVKVNDNIIINVKITGLEILTKQLKKMLREIDPKAQVIGEFWAPVYNIIITNTKTNISEEFVIKGLPDDSVALEDYADDPQSLVVTPFKAISATSILVDEIQTEIYDTGMSERGTTLKSVVGDIDEFGDLIEKLFWKFKKKEY
jgi:hypothetical protein